MTRTVLAIVAATMLAGAAQASDCTVTLDKYLALKMGSPYEEAVKAFGCEGTE